MEGTRIRRNTETQKHKTKTYMDRNGGRQDQRREREGRTRFLSLKIK
jgi:hypothetical protein